MARPLLYDLPLEVTMPATLALLTLPTDDGPPLRVLQLGPHRSPPLDLPAWLRVRDAAAAVDLEALQGGSGTDARGLLWSALVAGTGGWLLRLPRGVAPAIVAQVPALVRG